MATPWRNAFSGLQSDLAWDGFAVETHKVKQLGFRQQQSNINTILTNTSRGLCHLHLVPRCSPSCTVRHFFGMNSQQVEVQAPNSSLPAALPPCDGESVRGSTSGMNAPPLPRTSEEHPSSTISGSLLRSAPRPRHCGESVSALLSNSRPLDSRITFFFFFFFFFFFSSHFL